MIHLRCLLGIHRTEWVPAPGTGWCPQIRRCRDCHRPIGRQHQ